jgi:hemoglobin-like flavoprotein
MCKLFEAVSSIGLSEIRNPTDKMIEGDIQIGVLPHHIRKIFELRMRATDALEEAKQKQIKNLTEELLPALEKHKQEHLSDETHDRENCQSFYERMFKVQDEMVWEFVLLSQTEEDLDNFLALAIKYEFPGQFDDDEYLFFVAEGFVVAKRHRNSVEDPEEESFGEDLLSALTDIANYSLETQHTSSES